MSYNVKFTTSEVNKYANLGRSDGQVNSGSFTLHTVSAMQHLQAVIVGNSKPLGFCFGEQVSEPYPRFTYIFLESFQNYCYTLFFTRSKDAGALGKKSSSSLVFQYLYNIKVHLTIYLAHCT